MTRINSALARIEENRAPAIAAGLLLGVLAADAAMPATGLVGLLYAAAAVAGFWLIRPAQVIGLAALGTVLLAAGHFLTAPGAEGGAMGAIAGRAVGAAVIWMAAALALSQRVRRAFAPGAGRQADEAREVRGLGRFDLAAGRPAGGLLSPECRRLLHLPSDEAGPARALLERHIHEEDRPRLHRAIDEAFAESRPFELDFRVVPPEGGVRYLRAVGEPVSGPFRKVRRLAGSLADLTELKAAETALHDQEARIRSILETAPEAIVTIDERGIIDSFSAAAEALFGYESAEVVGRNVSLLMPAPHREQHDGYIRRYLETGERRIIGIGRVVEGVRKDGTVFPMELAVGEVAAEGQRLFTGFIRDLTARQRLEQELRQAQKMEAIGQLTGGVAHDFNNLLTVIMGNLEMLRDAMAGEGGRPAAWVEEAYEASELGAELAGRLLAFGRRQPLAPQPTDLAALLADSVKLMRRTLGETVEVQTRVAAGSFHALVDRPQLQSALLNLAINARDAMPDGGRLTLELRDVEVDGLQAAANPELPEGRYALISVTDNGVGMTREVKERAFEPFFTTKPVGVGTGLGLSSVYGFVKQSGGHVQIYSEPGQGTTIRLFLPCSLEGGPPAAEDQPTAESFQARGEKVLLVEDDARVRRVTAARLSGLGYRVIEADNGPAALALLDEHDDVDLLFTDMVMPGGMSGADLAGAVQARAPSIKLLFATGYAEPEMIGGEGGRGAQWLRKPHSTLELARAVRAALGG